MQNKVSSLEEKVEEIYDYQTDLNEVEKKLTDLEDSSGRNNLRIDRVAEENGETWDNCQRKGKETFMDKLELEMILLLKELIELKKGQYDKKDQLRTIVCKLLSYKDKFKVLRNCKKLKGSHIYIGKDFFKPRCNTQKSSGKK